LLSVRFGCEASCSYLEVSFLFTTCKSQYFPRVVNAAFSVFEQRLYKSIFREVNSKSGPGSSPGRGHCVVFLGKTLNSHSASLHPGV